MVTKYKLEKATIPRDASPLPPQFGESGAIPCTNVTTTKCESAFVYLYESRVSTFARVTIGDDEPRDFRVLTSEGTPYVLDSYDNALDLIDFVSEEVWKIQNSPSMPVSKV